MHILYIKLGVCAEQHRHAIGKYNSIVFKVCLKCKYDDISIWKMLLLSLAATGLICYMYMILLTMAIFVINVKDSWSCESPPKFITHTQIFIGENKFDKHLLNTAFL